MSERTQAVLRYIGEHEHDREWVTLPVVLHDDGDHMATLRLPTDLSWQEAERIAEIVRVWTPEARL